MGGSTTTAGGGGSPTTGGGTAGQGGSSGARDAGGDVSAGGSGGRGGAGGGAGGRDASTDGPCISQEGERCGGFVINPCRCADGLVCRTNAVPDAPGICVKPDAGQRSCLPMCNLCVSGICCGTNCCERGEWCDMSSGIPTCKCGNQAACTKPDTCQPFGPVGQFGCGDVCCSTNCPQ
jgi:hypothetical protein